MFHPSYLFPFSRPADQVNIILPHKSPELDDLLPGTPPPAVQVPDPPQLWAVLQECERGIQAQTPIFIPKILHALHLPQKKINFIF